MTPKRVVLRAGGPAGLMHGLASLRQLAGTGERSPRHHHRRTGFRLARPVAGQRPALHAGRVPAEVLDLMALYKFNVPLAPDRGPGLAPGDRPPRLTRSAPGATGRERPSRRLLHRGRRAPRGRLRRARGVTVVPEIEMPGHCRRRSRPTPSCRARAGLPVPTSGVSSGRLLRGQRPGVRVPEACSPTCGIFPSPYIHVGGDEAPKERWRACPRCQARMEAEGLADEAALQSWFVRRIGRWLAARGRRLVGWDEILEGGRLPAGRGRPILARLRRRAGGRAAGHDTVVPHVARLFRL